MRRLVRVRLELPPQRVLPYDALAWDRAIVVLEQGALELEGRTGVRLRVATGAVPALQSP